MVSRNKEGREMSYLLFRLPDPDADLEHGACLGSFATFGAALNARDDDAVALLAATEDGELMTAYHHIVGEGASGHHQRHPVISAVERRVRADDPAADLLETRRWLAEIHRPLS
jgi:hypothetical protein